VSDECVELIERAWGCEVFEHYGMTEMGLGGAMACEAHDGYHPREADLLFEIVDPRTGAPLPDGEYGEIVFTTLTRTAMPLVRYRTGDMSRFIPGPCPCGSVLKRLARVADRKAAKGY
jgi:phenylacetate-coenzyme A ligase PaaK-like adenylate-forming protein